MSSQQAPEPGSRTIAVRPVRDEDSAEIVALIGGCWAEYPGCVLDVDGEEPWMRRPATAYEEKGGSFWVVEAPGHLAACVGLRSSDEGATGAGVVELKSLYVDARSRRQGIGERLVAMVEQRAAELGATHVELWSDSRFTDAHRLYVRLGYRATGRTRDLHDLSHTTELHFAKLLGSA